MSMEREALGGLDPLVVLDLLPDPHVLLTPSFDIAYANDGVRAILGLDPRDVAGRNIIEFIHPDDLEAAAASISRVQGGTVNRDPVTVRVVAADGNESVVEARAGVGDERLAGHLVVKLVQPAEGIEDLESDRLGRLNLLGEVAQSCLNSPVGGLTAVLKEMLARTMTHCRAHVIEAHRFDDDHRTDVAMCWPAREAVAVDYAGSQLLSTGFRLLRESDATPMGISFLASRGTKMILEVFTEGPTGGEAGVLLIGWREEDDWVPSDFDVFGVLADLLIGLVSRADREGELHHQASHDRLTGLPNRFEFEQRSVAHFERLGTGRVGGLAVLFCDLDDFKAVNDRHGHHVGDQVLAAAADRLREVIRVDDTVGRYGGDEFVILCEVSDLAEAEDIAARATAAIREPIMVGELELSVGAGVGLTFTNEVQPLDELVKRADARMYEAKRVR